MALGITIGSGSFVSRQQHDHQINSAKFYKVTSEDGSKEYFHIEFRLDGGGHPPQLKVGPDLDKK